MTIEQLNEIIYLRREIWRDKQRIIEAETQATSTVGNYGGYVGGGNSVSDKVGNGAIRIAVLSSVLTEHLEKENKLLVELLTYIYTVRNSQIRDIMKRRFIDGEEWWKIAQDLNYSDGSVVYNMVKRYLESQEQAKKD